MRCKISATSDYIPIEKQYLLDAQKYIERAQNYADMNMMGHCAGCLAKAAKKLHRYNEHISFNANDISYVILKPMMDSLAQVIADNILKG